MPTGDIPKSFLQDTEPFDYVKRDEMITMRDGAKMKTFILVPKHTTQAPILLTRTPYNAAQSVMRFNSPRLTAVVPQMDEIAAESGYIIVFQDVRGKYGSEGDYVMNRPLVGSLNPTNVDDSTDCYDTIDWLVHNIQETNGRVGTIGGSYEGFTTLMSTIRPHPALRVTVPFAPMVDGWFDDWFHNGAFRQDGTLFYIYNQRIDSQGRPKMVDWHLRHLRGIFEGWVCGCCRGFTRTRSAWLLARAHRAHDLQLVLAKTSSGQASRRSAAQIANANCCRPI